MSVPATKPPKVRTTELQSKLHHAAKQNPQRRFHALYDKLSLEYVLWTAWTLVRQNGGTPGVDQQTLEAIEAQGVPEFLAELAQALQDHSYRPQPVRRVVIPKGDGRSRALGIPTVRDRVAQTAAKLLLEPIFEADFEGTPSFGFRPELGQLDALEVVRDHARKGLRWVVDGDLAQCFDTLDHARTMAALRRRISDGALLRLIYRWLKAGYRDDTGDHPTDLGSPQGGPLSPLLMNVYLYAFDQAARDPRSFCGRLVRFADDFVILCGTQAHAQKAHAWADAYLASLGLRLHPEKTRVVEDREGYDFLGFHHRRVPLRKQHGTESWGTLRWPSTKTCRKFRKEKLPEVLGTPWQLRHEFPTRIVKLERFLRGWHDYYCHGNSVPIFRKLDAYTRERIARHLARSQPTGKKRQRRHWGIFAEQLKAWVGLPTLEQIHQQKRPRYRGRGKVKWRAG